MAVVVFVAGLATVSVMAMIVGSLDAWSRGTSNTYAQTSTSIGAQKLAQEIREGQTASVASDRLTVVLPLQTEGDNDEVFYNRGTPGETRVYYISNGSLKRLVDGVESVVLTRVSAATFVVSGANVTVTLTSNESEGTADVRSKLQDKTATVKVRLRNCGT